MRKRAIGPFVLALLLSSGMLAQQNKQADIDLQAAIRTESVRGDLQAAIKQYETIVSKYGKDRAISAQALLHMAASYRKLGDAQSRIIYERVVRDYPDQTAAATEASIQLGNTGTAAGTASRQLWSLPPRGDINGTVSRDGRYIPFVDWAKYGDLYIHDLVTGDNRQITNTGTDGKTKSNGFKEEYAEESTFSRDGNQLAYSWFSTDRYELRTVDLQGSGVPQFRRLFDNEEVDWISPDDWSPDGKWLAVQLQRKDRSAQIGLVSVRDGSLRVLRSIDWRGSSKMSFSADGKFLAFDLPAAQDTEQRDVFVMAIDGSQIIPAVVYGSRDAVLGWSPDGSRLLFASDRTGSVGVWSVPFSDGKVQGEPELLKRDSGGFYNMGISESGALFGSVSDSISSDIRVATIDFTTGRLLSPPITAVQTFVGANSAPDWSPDGKRLAYASSRRTIGSGYWMIGIRSLETGESRELSLSPGLSQLSTLRWAPDGQSFIVNGRGFQGDTGVFRVDAQTGRTSLLLAKGAEESMNALDLSPNGKKLYLARSQSGQGRAVFERDLDSGNERELLRRPNLNNINLSPDGSYLTVGNVPTKDTNAASSILIVPTSGGEPRELMRLDNGYALAVEFWYPDGRWLILSKFLSSDPTRREFWKVSVDGSETTRLNLSLEFGKLHLHPDGQRVAFQVQQRNQNPEEIWVLENFLPVSKGKR